MRIKTILFPALYSFVSLCQSSSPSEHSSPVQRLEIRDTPIWAANFATATDSTGAGFGNVQVQYWDTSANAPGPVQNNGPAIPIVTHPKLGRSLRIHLNGATTSPPQGVQMRWEAKPGGGTSCGEGSEYYFRVDFVLGVDFPITQTNPFNLFNQIHQAATSGSPPVEFDVYNSRLAVRGQNAALHTLYAQDLGPVAVDTKYKLVYRVKFSTTPANSLLEVWLNGVQVLTNYKPPTATMNGGPSYWKGATAYCDHLLPPFTVYENAHKVGATFASVNA